MLLNDENTQIADAKKVLIQNVRSSTHDSGAFNIGNSLHFNTLYIPREDYQTFLVA